MERKACVQAVHPSQTCSIWIKIFCLCETSGYRWNSFVYLQGKEPDGQDADQQLVNPLGRVVLLSLD